MVEVPDGAAASAATPAAGTALDQVLPPAAMDLPLTDQDGNVVTLASLAGKTVVVSPNLTLCQEVCPLISANLGAVTRAVNTAGLQDSVEVVEVTVDPERDDRAHLKAYQGMYGAQPNWEFLRGTPDEIAQFWNAFHLSYGRSDEASGASATDWLTGAPLTYDVQHQNVVYIVGPDGHLRWLMDAAPDVRGTSIPAPLESYLSDEGRQNVASPVGPAWTPGDVEAGISFVTGTPLTS